MWAPLITLWLLFLDLWKESPPGSLCPAAYTIKVRDMKPSKCFYIVAAGPDVAQSSLLRGK